MKMCLTSQSLKRQFFFILIIFCIQNVIAVDLYQQIKIQQHNKRQIQINSNNKQSRWLLQQNKMYKIGSFMYGNRYLRFNQNRLECQKWTNNTQQFFYFQHINYNHNHNHNQYRIISVQSLRAIRLFQFQDRYEFRFGHKKVDLNKFSQKIHRNNKQNNNQTQQQQKEILQYEQQQIWLLQHDISTKQGFFLKSLNSNQYLNAQKILQRYTQPMWSQIKYKDKNNTWLIRKISPQLLLSSQQYQSTLGQLYKNISYNLLPQRKYELWMNFYQLFYQYQYHIIQNKLNMAKWLNQYNWNHSYYDMIQSADRQGDIDGFYVKNGNFKTNIRPNCIKGQKIIYIWVGDKQMPIQYKNIIKQCQQSILLLNMNNMREYSSQWNEIYPQTQIFVQNINIRRVADLLKKLYLFFQGGLYADFDTEINQECFSGILTDDVIYTNYVPIAADFSWIPQENFMKVNQKYNPQIKKMIQAEVRMQQRWEQCRNRQCLIVNCQRHLYDRTYLRGYQ